MIDMVPERVSGPMENPGRLVWHLMDGEWREDATWQPILCGDGIAWPWRERRPKSDACPVCAALLDAYPDGAA